MAKVSKEKFAAFVVSNFKVEKIEHNAYHIRTEKPGDYIGILNTLTEAYKAVPERLKYNVRGIAFKLPNICLLTGYESSNKVLLVYSGNRR